MPHRQLLRGEYEREVKEYKRKQKVRKIDNGGKTVSRHDSQEFSRVKERFLTLKKH